jgi:hypothetical protein
MAEQDSDNQSLEVQPEGEQPQGGQREELTPEEQALADSNHESTESDENQEVADQQQESDSNTEGVGEEPQQMSRRAAKRLEKLEGLIGHIRGSQRPQEQRQRQGIDYRKMIEADDQVYDQLDKASQDYGQAQFSAGLQEAQSVRFHTRLEIDAPRIEGKYPQFDKGSQEFNPGLASAVNEWYLATVGYDPDTDTVANVNVRYADFVEGIMDLADAMAGQRTARTTQNIARQAANAGLRPDGSSAKPLNLNKAPEDMSEAELNAAISASMPRDTRGRFTAQK